MSARGATRVVLYAEDDANDATLLKRVIAKAFPEHQLHVVKDGQEAMDYLAGRGRYGNRSVFQMPDLVLLDIGLPKVSGLDVLAWIRAQPGLRGLVVLILTGSSLQQDMQRAYDLHANSFLKKQPILALPRVSKGILDYWLNLNQLPSL